MLTNILISSAFKFLPAFREYIVGSFQLRLSRELLDKWKFPTQSRGRFQEIFRGDGRRGGPERRELTAQELGTFDPALKYWKLLHPGQARFEAAKDTIQAIYHVIKRSSYQFSEPLHTLNEPGHANDMKTSDPLLFFKATKDDLNDRWPDFIYLSQSGRGFIDGLGYAVKAWKVGWQFWFENCLPERTVLNPRSKKDPNWCAFLFRSPDHSRDTRGLLIFIQIFCILWSMRIQTVFHSRVRRDTKLLPFHGVKVPSDISTITFTRGHKLCNQDIRISIQFLHCVLECQNNERLIGAHSINSWTAHVIGWGLYGEVL